WAPRIAANRQATLPAEYEQCLVTGRIDSLRLTWQKGDEPLPAALRLAVACGSVNALHIGGGVAPLNEVQEIMAQVEVMNIYY
ncbi:MAG: hypothetical protein H7Y32_15940, partial [Chloroflexales bacterium]|nr:hypothetical protein [Chloroflexales bacterium]